MNPDLNRLLDRTKSQVFLGSNASILGSIMCSLNFIWCEETRTASTNGKSLKWNPTWFLTLSEETRKTVLVHELWHVAKLHMLRGDGKRHKEWNQACDISINNALQDDGYTFEGTEPCIGQQYSGMAEESIYEDIVQNSIELPNPSWEDGDGEGDLEEVSKADQHEIVNNVVRAMHQSKSNKEAGALSKDVGVLLEKFLKPIIPWQTLLFQFFSALIEEEHSWKRPNRRYQDMYLPSVQLNESRLESLNYYFDVSGSVSNSEVERFNSEVKYIKETFNPEKLTVVQFDTTIKKVDVFTPQDRFDKLVVVGRGGTSLICVREHIQETMPTAAIIFSDLYCPRMHKLDKPIPVIWVVVDNPTVEVEFGKMIHIPR
jgi:predicted metal-dependent peptidase